ncbi:MAG: heavy metal translocating P-type ATPase [Oscillospiraceae bacterium]|jgi:Cd2+/Zn2+-exporting ATPase|nr:cadmium-translocating P-type ATPase [Oscillospiraceae bacterium]MDD4510868.1 heavy metal translocating P-type ATPase [Oscillospiraceae bacterium]
MQKEYLLQGLDCANCAAKIENAVKNQSGVLSATLNFMTTSLKLEVSESYAENITAGIADIVRKYEPDVVVIDKGTIEKNHDHGHDHSHGGESSKKQIIQLITGAVIFGAGILMSKLFELNIYAELAIFLVAYLILGGGVVLRALKNITKGQIFDENFLMSVATIGAFAIGDFPEAVAVMLFYQIGEYFQDAAVRSSKKSIADLMDIRPDSATIKKGNELVKVSPETVAVGDFIVVKPGEKIPLDGVVIDGESMLDTKALTGESVPRTVKAGDTALSGCINQNGVLTIEVTKTFGESTVAKIIDLVENASSKKAPTENFITTFSRYYTPVVVGLAALLAVIPPIFMGGVWSEWINRGLIFLVISCPCALVISIPLGFFGGIGGASKKGVLVKGSNYLEALGNLDIVVFDKTGTLTKGVFQVIGVYPANEFTESELLEYAANAEAFSNHPIALSILKAYDKPVDKERLEDYSEISGHGIRVSVNGKVVLTGNDKLMKTSNIPFLESNDIGTKVYVAVDNQFAGCIVISDEIKEDSRDAIAGLKARGIRKTVMLTGDNAIIGEAIAKELALDEVYAGLLPDQKVEKLEMLDGQKRYKGKLAFVGDGINDAPVLARADVGIAMGGLGSDAAIEAADIVLMTDEPSKLLDAIDIAKFTKRIVWQNIFFALGIKGIFLLLGAFGIATMWEAVFADVGVSVIAILNAMRVMRMK